MRANRLCLFSLIFVAHVGGIRLESNYNFNLISAFLALQGIASSLNYNEGLGTLSLSLMYATNFISSMFIGPPLIKLLTPKWLMCISFLAHTFFTIAHFWSSAPLLMTSGVILGIAFSPAWVANGTYITVLASRYSQKTGKDLAAALQLFNGIFYLVFSLHGIPANIAISTILKVKRNKSVCSHSENSTIIRTKMSTSEQSTSISNSQNDCTVDISVCGAAHCPFKETHNEVFEKPQPELLNALLACFLVLNVIGIFLTALLPSDVKTEESNASPKKNILSTLKVCIIDKHYKD